MLVIGIAGRARSGKDTSGRYLKEKYGSIYNIRTYSFGAALKLEVNELYERLGSWDKVFGYIHHNIVDLPEWVCIEHSPDLTDPLCPYGKQRTLLQWWGSEYRRFQSPNYWVRKLSEVIDADEPQIAIITDVRFSNEFFWIKSFGRDGIMMRVARPGFNNGINDHISEMALDDFEFDVDIAASSLEELYEDVDVVMDSIISREVIPDEFLEEPK